MKFMFFFLTSCVYFSVGQAQINKDSIQQVLIKNYYSLGVQSKDGLGVEMNYSNAFYYFKQAADLNDPQSIYSLGYMYYKGLGCEQNYNKAASLFSLGAFLGRDNSMYFYGLCFRNGYGLFQNSDSAKYWLKKSADLGYAQAVQELKMGTGENSNDSIKVLIERIKNVSNSSHKDLSQYQKVKQNNMTLLKKVEGKFDGYIIQYDWSGKYLISYKKLELILSVDGQSITGQWMENNTDTIQIAASLKADSIVFERSHYKRKDHYSPYIGLRYDFQNASLNIEEINDSIFLVGNITMFSPDRKEPSKPQFIALTRALQDASKISVNPNPFHNIINLNFNLTTSSDVLLQLISSNGSIVYTKKMGKIQAGFNKYSLFPGTIAAGAYILRLTCNNQFLTFKLIKE